jgi:RND family efflux transporter MFP subunit
MRDENKFKTRPRNVKRRLHSFWFLFVTILTGGCQRQSPADRRPDLPDDPTATAVQIIKPERKSLSYRIEQPGFNIEAFQETPLYPRISGYVRKWKADIGDTVHKDDVLAELAVPEMEVDLRQKDAAVQQANAQIGQARAAVRTAQAELKRLKSQHERFARLEQKGATDRQNLEEIGMSVESAEAALEKAQADLAAAEALVEVAKANRDYSKTMLAYAQILAPFDGVVTRRNVNTGDFVQPAGAAAKAQPLFVISQIDPVRVFVNVPGADAAWIHNKDAVSLRLQGAGGELFEGQVTRNARSLDPQARTLRTEIDLPNPKGKLLPGMYVQAAITVQHPNAWSLPVTAILTEGDQIFCYRVEGGKVLRTTLQIGIRGDGLVEILKKQTQLPSSEQKGRWEDITGEEEIVANGTASFSDGQTVRRAQPGR